MLYFTISVMELRNCHPSFLSLKFILAGSRRKKIKINTDYAN